VLRSQILLKDRRWLVIVPIDSDPAKANNPGSEGELQIVITDDPMDFPIAFEGAAQSPLTPMKAEPRSAPSTPDIGEQVHP
jgi:hypothetical protein